MITLGLRATFILLPGRVRLPALLRRGLPFIPAAVLTAIWAPELALQKRSLTAFSGKRAICGGLVAIAVAWRWRLTFATIASGLLALHLFDWLL